jgi:hypothetical protein
LTLQTVVHMSMERYTTSMADNYVKIIVLILAVTVFSTGIIMGYAFGKAQTTQNYLQAEMDDKPGANMVTITIPQDNLHKVDIDTTD